MCNSITPKTSTQWCFDILILGLRRGQWYSIKVKSMCLQGTLNVRPIDKQRSVYLNVQKSSGQLFKCANAYVRKYECASVQVHAQVRNCVSAQVRKYIRKYICKCASICTNTQVLKYMRKFVIAQVLAQVQVRKYIHKCVSEQVLAQVLKYASTRSCARLVRKYMCKCVSAQVLAKVRKCENVQVRKCASEQVLVEVRKYLRKCVSA